MPATTTISPNEELMKAALSQWIATGNDGLTQEELKRAMAFASIKLGTYEIAWSGKLEESDPEFINEIKALKSWCAGEPVSDRSTKLARSAMKKILAFTSDHKPDVKVLRLPSIPTSSWDQSIT